MIVGGGPAGMEVARVSALRGHDVLLCEKEGELGGQIRMASKVPRKDRIGLITQYLSNELKKAGAKVKLNLEITPKIVYEMAPDVLVVATGSSPFTPPTIPGIDKEHVYDVFELILGKAKVGKKVAVIGAGGNGCHATEFITEKGASVVLIEPSSAIGKGLGPRSGWFLLGRIKQNPKIEIRTNTTLEEIHDSCITVQKEGKWEEIPNIDTVVLALGQISNNKLAEAIKREQKIEEVYTVGDCVQPKTALEAIYQGACVGHRL
jgi:NADPH-dependent 2,4-dienoyl-CoA reductase/sulfur reductase-like enzyme